MIHEVCVRRRVGQMEAASPQDGANAGELTHEALLRCLVMSVGKPFSKF